MRVVQSWTWSTLRDPWVLLAFAIASVIALRNLLDVDADLGIYLDSAREMAQGSMDVYRSREPRGAFAYLHAALLPLVLLQALLSDTGVRIVYALGMGLATAMIAIDLRQASRLLGGLRWWQWLVLVFLFQRCIAQNLTHGQLSLWIGTFALRGALRLAQGRDVAAGVWLGLACMKLTPVLFLVALPVMGRLRAALSCLVTVAVLVFLLPWPLLGSEQHWFQLDCFYRAVLAPMLGGGGELAVMNYHSGASVAGVFDYLLQARPLDAEGRTINVVQVTDGTLRIVKLCWSAMILAILGMTWLRASKLPGPVATMLRCSVVLLAMSLLAPLTRVYHLAAILLPGLLFCTGPRRRDVLWWLVALGLAFSMPLRQKKLIGETLWRTFDHYGLLHFALVGLCVWLLRNAPSLSRPGSDVVAAPAL